MIQIKSLLTDEAALTIARKQLVSGYIEKAETAGIDYNKKIRGFFDPCFFGPESFFIVSQGKLYLSCLGHPDPWAGEINPYGCDLRWINYPMAEAMEYEQWLHCGSTFLLTGKAKVHAEFFDSGELIPTFRKLKQLQEESDSKEELSERIKTYLSTLDKGDWARAMLNIENNIESFPFDNTSECRLEDCPCGCGAVLGQTWYV